MIQRIQSIWLFLAGITLFLILIIPIVSKQGSGIETWIQGSGRYEQTGNLKQKVEAFMPLTINIIAVGLLCMVNIFNFRNRSMQKRFIWTAIVLILTLSFLIFNFAQRLPGGIQGAAYGAGAFLPVLALVFCGLAIRGIRKDEQLLRSADRLR